MRKRLIRKASPGMQIQGGLNSLMPTPPSITDMVPNIDLNSIKLLSPIVTPEYSSSNILGNLFKWDSSKGSKFGLAFNKANIGSTMNLAGGIADTLGSLIPKKEQSGLTTGLNNTYDKVSNAVAAIPGWGTLASGIMKVGGFVSDGLTALGVGTDLMTTADKILDSKFLKLTPLGLINAIGGKRADTITKNEQAFELVGSSYGGTASTVDSALEKSGKKYGLLSSRGRRKANDEIAEAKRLLALMTDIANDSAERLAIQSSMSAINNNRYAFELQGGYKQSAVRVGKLGMKIISDELILRARLTLKYLNEGKTKKQRTLDELISYAKEKNPRFILRMSEPIKFIEWDDLNGHHTGTHLMGWADDGKGHAIVYSEILEDENGNLKKYSTEEAIRRAIKLGNILEMTPEEAELFTNSPDTTRGYKKGWPEFFGAPVFYKDGGKMNVIPDGALHARLHHMDVDNITKKGIPVVSEENGELVLLAEIERNEIIFTKEVTELLEKLYRLGTDKAAIEAGKIIAREIMENTLDNTGLISEVA